MKLIKMSQVKRGDVVLHPVGLEELRVTSKIPHGPNRLAVADYRTAFALSDVRAEEHEDYDVYLIGHVSLDSDEESIAGGPQAS